MNNCADLTGKNIIIGITGGIAVYKVVDLVNRLKTRGGNVHVVMTEAARAFVQPLTFEVISGHKVITDLFEGDQEFPIPHIDLASKADVVAIIPATANMIGKVAHGLGDDLLSSLVLAATCPIVFAPAMNTNMFNNAFVQDNILTLKCAGYSIVEPGEGMLACGVEGKGRLQEIDLIEDHIVEVLSEDRDLWGKKVLITAGPTREYLDPVRFLSNKSTGTMGYELAEAAYKRGAQVFLISGPTAIEPPAGVNFISVESAQDMYERSLKLFPEMDIVIMVAAVSDYRPEVVSEQKIKKRDDDLTVPLSRNPDILLEMGRRKQKQKLIGFAAETNNLLEYAQGKLKEKNLDMIIANNVLEKGAGFGGDTNKVTIIKKDGLIEDLPIMLKTETANEILDRIRFM